MLQKSIQCPPKIYFEEKLIKVDPEDFILSNFQKYFLSKREGMQMPVKKQPVYNIYGQIIAKNQTKLWSGTDTVVQQVFQQAVSESGESR